MRHSALSFSLELKTIPWFSFHTAQSMKCCYEKRCLRFWKESLFTVMPSVWGSASSSILAPLPFSVDKIFPLFISSPLPNSLLSLPDSVWEGWVVELACLTRLYFCQLPLLKPTVQAGAELPGWRCKQILKHTDCLVASIMSGRGRGLNGPHVSLTHEYTYTCLKVQNIH